MSGALGVKIWGGGVGGIIMTATEKKAYYKKSIIESCWYFICILSVKSHLEMRITIEFIDFCNFKIITVFRN